MPRLVKSGALSSKRHLEVAMSTRDPAASPFQPVPRLAGADVTARLKQLSGLRDEGVCVRAAVCRMLPSDSLVQASAW